MKKLKRLIELKEAHLSMNLNEADYIGIAQVIDEAIEREEGEEVIGDVDVQKLIEKLEDLDIPQDAPVHVRDGGGRWIRVSKIEFWGGLILID